MSAHDRSPEAAPRAAFNVGDYRDYLLFLARRSLAPRLWARDDPSDVVNQTLHDGHRDLAQFRGSTSGELAAWLRQILFHKINRVASRATGPGRDMRREVPLWHELEESSVMFVRAVVAKDPSPSEQADRNEQVLRLAAALARLPDEYRLVIELRYFHHWTAADIAEHLGKTRGAVAGLIHRGLKELHTLLEPQEPR